MNRKNEEDRKDKISISLHPEISKLIEKYSIIENINKSKLIERILKDYFEKEFNHE